jgi:hypothetical protein
MHWVRGSNAILGRQTSDFVKCLCLSLRLSLCLARHQLVERMGPLARHIRSRNEFLGSRWHFQSATMRWLCGYNNYITIGADPNGLYLSTLPIFPLFHPPLFIPWTEISLSSKNLFFAAGVRFELGRESSIPLWVRKRLAERIKAAAGQAYPIETIEP